MNRGTFSKTMVPKTPYIRDNFYAAEQLIAVLRSTGLQNDNLPLEWTALSLQYDLHKRSTAADLVSVIVRVSKTLKDSHSAEFVVWKV